MRTRLGSGVILCGVIGIVALAGLLVPSPTGMGTHEQLGLPPCPLHALVHIPCPACGLTTSLAHLVRGDVTASWHTHPFGIVIAALLCALAITAAIALRRPRVWQHVLTHRWLPATCVVGTICFLGLWIVRLIR